MVFKTKRLDDFSYDSPQAMYQDNKLKKIMGPLDYQTAMLDQYIGEIDKRTLALELPTGSGKTLVGLLIGEYRRRKNKEKILFLCPTNQLVYQVVMQANEKYGLKATAFCGKQNTYTPADKTDYLLANTIGVTTYSSFFAQHSFFDDVDVIIMDDVHSSENYIISGWSIQIERETIEFMQLADLFKTVISEVDYNNLISEYNQYTKNWYNLVPMPLLFSKTTDIFNILQSNLTVGTSNYYAFERIKEHLKECNIYLSNGCILIRPWIAPTMTFEPFASAKQKILMSATLGKSGELERITGIDKITRLPVVNDWDKKGLGRKFFIFPDLSLDRELLQESIIKLHKRSKRSLMLVPTSPYADEMRSFFEEHCTETLIFNAKDIEESKDSFVKSDDAIAILANRFDGIDFADNECRMLFIVDLPKTTNIQEQFLISRMGASKLYSERIRTRIIQAVGRCSRNPSDYSVVCIIGDTIKNDLTKQEKQKQFPPELRAELQFGLENSLEYSSADAVMEQVEDFSSRNKTWQEAENYIVELRNSYWADVDEKSEMLMVKLQEAAINELKYEYSIWKQDYKGAYEAAQSVVGCLDAPSLSGYKSFWNYICGSLAYFLYMQGQIVYKKVGIKNITEAYKDNLGIRWLPELNVKLFATNEADIEEDNYFKDVIEKIENVFTEIHSSKKLEARIQSILTNLQSLNGTTFETGHKDLGNLLGYTAKKIDTQGAPDPYWIVNSMLCIVSEDKIYETKSGCETKSIPIKDVTEAGRHKAWIRENEKQLSPDAEIITVFISNASTIEKDARTFADGIYFLERKHFLEWAVCSTTILRSGWDTFVDAGDADWRNTLQESFITGGTTPKDLIALIKQRGLKTL